MVAEGTLCPLGQVLLGHHAARDVGASLSAEEQGQKVSLALSRTYPAPNGALVSPSSFPTWSSRSTMRWMLRLWRSL